MQKYEQQIFLPCAAWGRLSNVQKRWHRQRCQMTRPGFDAKPEHMTKKGGIDKGLSPTRGGR